MPRFSRYRMALALLVFGAAIPGCNHGGKVIARLGERAIDEAEFQKHVDQTYSTDERAALLKDPEARRQALSDYFDTLAIQVRAKRLGLLDEPRFRKAVELTETKILAHLMTERYRSSIVKNSEVTADEVAAYYERHRQDFLEEPRFTARQLLVYVKGNPAFPERGLSDSNAHSKARRALAKLNAGESWDAVVKTHSDEWGTNPKGGLIRDGQFGHFAPEVEAAIRSQPLGVPGRVIKSQFGYHIVVVEQRILEGVARPFEEVKTVIEERLQQAHSSDARNAFLGPFREELRFSLKAAAQRDVSLLDPTAIAPEEVLAEIEGKPIIESDFQWFIKDAFTVRQRTVAFGRPGARLGLMNSFLDMRVLEAKARRLGLDKSPEFAQRRASSTQQLMTEFVSEHDKVGPFRPGDDSEAVRKTADADYFARLRTEAKLVVVAP